MTEIHFHRERPTVMLSSKHYKIISEIVEVEGKLSNPQNAKIALRVIAWMLKMVSSN